MTTLKGIFPDSSMSFTKLFINIKIVTLYLLVFVMIVIYIFIVNYLVINIFFFRISKRKKFHT